MTSGCMCLANHGLRLTTPGKRSSVCVMIVILLRQNSNAIKIFDINVIECENEADHKPKDADDGSKDQIASKLCPSTYGITVMLGILLDIFTGFMVVIKPVRTKTRRTKLRCQTPCLVRLHQQNCTYS